MACWSTRVALLALSGCVPKGMPVETPAPVGTPPPRPSVVEHPAPRPTPAPAPAAAAPLPPTEPLPPTPPVNRTIIGLAVPLQGRLRAIGEAALEGALEAMDAFSPKSSGILEIADSSASTQAAVQDLQGRGVEVIVGGLDATETESIRTAAIALGLPHVSLTPPEATARARLLGQEALRANLARLALLAPEGAYGTAVIESFRQAIAPLSPLAVRRYPTTTTHFEPLLKNVCVQSPDAVFIGDAASRLEMIAPALAAAGCHARIFATAESASPQLLRAHRYLSDAVIAPGFYPDTEDSLVGPFATTFSQTRTGRLPGIYEAIAFAAVRAAQGLPVPLWPPLYRITPDRISALR